MTFVLSSAQIAVPAAASADVHEAEGHAVDLDRLDVVLAAQQAQRVVDELRQRPRLGHGRVGDRHERDAPGGHPRDVRVERLGLRLDLVVEVEALQRDAPQTAVLLFQLEEPEAHAVLRELDRHEAGVVDRRLDLQVRRHGVRPLRRVPRRRPELRGRGLGLEEGVDAGLLGGAAAHEAEPARALAGGVAVALDTDGARRGRRRPRLPPVVAEREVRVEALARDRVSSDLSMRKASKYGSSLPSLLPGREA